MKSHFHWFTIFNNSGVYFRITYQSFALITMFVLVNQKKGF